MTFFWREVTWEFALLTCLMRSRGQVLSKTQILDAVWDMNYEGPDNIVEVYSIPSVPGDGRIADASFRERRENTGLRRLEFGSHETSSGAEVSERNGGPRCQRGAAATDFSAGRWTRI